MIYNQIVTWTAFAILAMFQVTYKCKPAFAIFVYMSLLFSFVRSFCLSILFIFKRTFLKTISAFGDLKYLSHAEYNFIRLMQSCFRRFSSSYLVGHFQHGLLDDGYTLHQLRLRNHERGSKPGIESGV